jgi:reverse gyrase
LARLKWRILLKSVRLPLHQQVDAKEIDEVKFRELVNELDMERAMAESVAEGPVTTQDEEVGRARRVRGGGTSGGGERH